MQEFRKCVDGSGQPPSRAAHPITPATAPPSAPPARKKIIIGTDGVRLGSAVAYLFFSHVNHILANQPFLTRFRNQPSAKKNV
jgi:hypothetical protein